MVSTTHIFYSHFYMHSAYRQQNVEGKQNYYYYLWFRSLLYGIQYIEVISFWELPGSREFIVRALFAFFSRFSKVVLNYIFWLWNAKIKMSTLCVGFVYNSFAEAKNKHNSFVNGKFIFLEYFSWMIYDSGFMCIYTTSSYVHIPLFN